MIKENFLLEKWRSLPEDKQQEVIDFVEFLESRIESKFPNSNPVDIPTQTPPISSLGAKLQQLRENIIASGVSLLTAEEVEQEKARRRGGYQEVE